MEHKKNIYIITWIIKVNRGGFDDFVLGHKRPDFVVASYQLDSFPGFQSIYDLTSYMVRLVLSFFKKIKFTDQTTDHYWQYMTFENDMYESYNTSPDW